MAISRIRWLDATVFLSDVGGELIGTAFLIRHKDLIGKEDGLFPKYGPEFVYLVTAHHVVSDSERTFANLRLQSGGVHPAEVSGWLPHPARARESDVAVAPFVLPDKKLDVRPIGSRDLAIGQRDNMLHVYGMDVYYAGLLTHVPEMGERMIPMVRSGKLGAWDQRGLPFRPDADDDTVLKLRGHLVDCYGYYGFSGSPCFVQYESWGPEGEYGYKTSILGVMIGFFDFRVDTPDGPVHELPVNAGVAIVAPAWDILETLNRKEFMEDRKERTDDEKESRSGKPKPGPAESASPKRGP